MAVSLRLAWVPAFAGMTEVGGVRLVVARRDDEGRWVEFGSPLHGGRTGSCLRLLPYGTEAEFAGVFQTEWNVGCCDGDSA